MTQGRPRLQAPPGATDTHMHFYDVAERYPVAPTAALIGPMPSFASPACVPTRIIGMPTKWVAMLRLSRW